MGHDSAPAVTHPLTRKPGAELLIDATAQLLEIRGDDVTVQDIAERAGVSLRVLYRCFRSKDALLIAVLEDRLSRRADELRVALAQIDDPIDRITWFILSTVDFPANPFTVALARNSVSLSVSCPEDVNRAQAAMAALGSELLAFAVDRGAIDPVVADQGAYVLLEMRRTYNHSRMFGGEIGIPAPEPADLARFTLRSFGVESADVERSIAAFGGRL